jgi:hypothetical protein
MFTLNSYAASARAEEFARTASRMHNHPRLERRPAVRAKRPVRARASTTLVLKLIQRRARALSDVARVRV